MDRLVDTSDLLLKELDDLVDDRVKNFPTKQVARYRQLSVEQANSRVVRILDVEACEVEHVVIIFDASVVELIGLAEGVH